MAVNQKAIKVLNKIFEAGFTDEKEISAMTMPTSGLSMTCKRVSRRTRSFPFWAVVRNEKAQI